MPSREPLTKVTIKNDDGSGVKRYEDVLLEFTESGKNSKFAIVDSRRDEVITSAYLDECKYLEESSAKEIDCFDMTKARQTVMIFYKDAGAKYLLEEMRRFCQNPQSPKRPEPPSVSRPRSRSRSRSRTPPPPPRGRARSPSPARPSRSPQRNFTGKINEFIQALNEQDQNRAQRAAEDLARDRAKVQFALDISNEGGNKSAAQAPPAPVRQKIDLKLTIESFLVDQCNDQKYDVSILVGTKISDLKGMVQQQAGIPSAQQFWYIGRDNLADHYEFGTSTSTVNANTALTLFITKPKNN